MIFYCNRSTIIGTMFGTIIVSTNDSCPYLLDSCRLELGVELYRYFLLNCIGRVLLRIVLLSYCLLRLQFEVTMTVFCLGHV